MSVRMLWVCLWHHKHGTDVGLYTTEALAKQCMAEILVNDCVDEIENFFDTKKAHNTFKKNVAKMFEMKMFTEIIDAWRSHVSDESFEFLERPVVTEEE